MTARSLMTQRAAVERNVATGRDRSNHPVAEDWQPLNLTSTYGQPRLPCFLWSERERRVDSGVNAQIATVHLGIPEAAPITPADRITTIYDAAGEVLDPHRYRIIADERMGRSHRELTLEVVTGGAGAAG